MVIAKQTSSVREGDSPNKAEMRSLHSLPYLLLLPLSACFPLLDRRGPTDVGDIGARMSWAHLAEGRRPHPVRGPSPWPRVPQPQALFVVAKELQALRREHTGFRLGRQDGSSEAAGFLPTDSEKASSPLGTLAEELSSYSRRKGGFSFRFGR
ncbi:hypothetical protein A6R68_02189 [Neotoma lepida]|uniref:Orexigenic neuropeptide QRFP n=1 Tax=Neotoma lepida TaxID=56216 RepID=A0A1A6GTM4_NEOLE|nr:hypothetical protein A6R68_02189 [Neotoma lepida]